jgi:uncharacterized membrane protein
MASRAQSIPTIDTLKGFSMIMMFYMHFAWAWRANDWYSLVRFEWYVTEFFGMTAFILMSLVGNMTSLQARWESGDRSTYTRRKLLRLSFLLIIGECMNLMFIPAVGPFHAIIWNALTGIVLFSLLLPLIMRLPVTARLLIIGILIALYYPLLEWAMAPMNAAGLAPTDLRLEHLLDPRTLIYFIFFNHAVMIPIYPWFIVMLLTSVVFGQITTPHTIQSKDLFKREIKRIAVVGLCLIVLCIATGSNLVKDYDIKTFNELLVPGQFFTWPISSGIPTFLIRHVPQSVLYGTGITYVWFACVCWFQVMKDKHLPMQDKTNNVGRYSLTAYVLTHVAMLIPIKLSMAAFYVVIIPSLILFVWGLWMWNKKYQGVGTLDFAMEVHAQAMSMLIDKYKARHGD